MSENDAKKNLPNVYGEVCLRTQRRKRRKVLLIDLLLDYAKNSTLHGLRYIADTYSIVEKVFWLLTFIVSITMCSLLIRNVYNKWKTSPVIVSFSEQIVPVGKVPFPSVTICPQTKIMAGKYNFTEEYQKYKDTDETENVTALRMLDDAALLCVDNEIIDSHLERNSSNSSVVEHLYNVRTFILPLYSKLGDILYSLGETSIGLPLCTLSPVEQFSRAKNSTRDGIYIIQKLLDGSGHGVIKAVVDDMFYICAWRDNPFDCNDLFSRVLTNEGVCFNFNSLAANEIFRNSTQREYDYLENSKPSVSWSPSKGYTNYSEHSYPFRGKENGAVPDLEVYLAEKIGQRDDLCNIFSKGYKIYVQNPADMPQSSLYYYAALHNQVSSLALKFHMLTTSDSLKDYSADVRQCYFQNDRPLRYFAIYTQNNCRLECQSNYTFKMCGCVWYNMPHNDSRNICTFSSRTCVKMAQAELADQEIKGTEETNDGSVACQCYPDCYSIYYDAEILKTEYDFKNFFQVFYKLYPKFQNDNESVLYNFSKIEMYFKEPRFVSMRRSELFGLTDFMANCGGLLGLFLGFSFLSLVEIVYFVTIRLFYSFKRDLKTEKANRMKAEEILSKRLN